MICGLPRKQNCNIPTRLEMWWQEVAPPRKTISRSVTSFFNTRCIAYFPFFIFQYFFNFSAYSFLAFTGICIPQNDFGGPLSRLPLPLIVSQERDCKNDACWFVTSVRSGFWSWRCSWGWSNGPRQSSRPSLVSMLCGIFSSSVLCLGYWMASSTALLLSFLVCTNPFSLHICTVLHLCNKKRIRTHFCVWVSVRERESDIWIIPSFIPSWMALFFFFFWPSSRKTNSCFHRVVTLGVLVLFNEVFLYFSPLVSDFSHMMQTAFPPVSSPCRCSFRLSLHGWMPWCRDSDGLCTEQKKGDDDGGQCWGLNEEAPVKGDMKSRRSLTPVSSQTVTGSSADSGLGAFRWQKLSPAEFQLLQDYQSGLPKCF